MGPLVFRGSPPPAEGGQTNAYAPRRYVLDKILVDAAVEAGVELREGVEVQEILMDGDRVTGIRTADGIEEAKIVIGAEGMGSMVAKRVAAPEYDVREARLSACYSYFSGVEMLEGVQAELYLADHRAIFGWPTNDGTVIFGANFQAHELEAVAKDPEGHVFSVLDES